ncbi:MAG: 50S ribosomal protein L13 [Flavobacteriales bacterium]
MDTLSYKTISANKENANTEWFVIDAEGQRLGRLASNVAKLVRGKHKTNFTPHANCGDVVVVVNADKIELSGQKWENKTYIRHTGYPGGQRTATAREVMEKNPIALVERAVKGMLPKNTLGRELYRTNLYVYAGGEHNHEAQKPKSIKLEDIK